MSHNWHTSKRPEHPPGWKHTRALVVSKAGGLCQATPPCPYPGTAVDHIQNLAQNGNHDLANLQLLCTWHHKEKTAKEAAVARKPRQRETRPQQKHPGII